jgi:hypothetical protein
MDPLTVAEAQQALAGLYERRTETNRYIADEEQRIAAHTGHGVRCCGHGIIDRATASRAALTIRLELIDRAIAKLEQTRS